jgi:thiol-disulfide isomerase/thioredoxin
MHSWLALRKFKICMKKKGASVSAPANPGLTQINRPKQNGSFFCDHSGMENIAPSLLVTCLCAQWCGTCNSYRVTFEQLKAEFPQVQWRWIDIEDEADLVDPVDIENFPTVLIGHGKQLRFFGTITPHAETLRRLVQNQLDTADPGPSDADASALLNRIFKQRPV